MADKVASKTALLTVVVHPQWSRVCELVLSHLWVHIYVRWVPNGTMDQPLGMWHAECIMLASDLALEKIQFFAVARDFVCTPETVLPD